MRVVLLEADVDDVALLEVRQHGPPARDEDAVALADAHVAAVRAEQAGDEEVPADALELLEDGGAHTVASEPTGPGS